MTLTPDSELKIKIIKEIKLICFFLILTSEDIFVRKERMRKIEQVDLPNLVSLDHKEFELMLTKSDYNFCSSSDIDRREIDFQSLR